MFNEVLDKLEQYDLSFFYSLTNMNRFDLYIRTDLYICISYEEGAGLRNF